MATFGPPSVAGTLNRLTDSIGNSIDNYRLGQELQNMPRAADGSPDYQAMSMRLMQINPQAARQMMAMEELRQRRAYQERSLANQERQTDIAADKTGWHTVKDEENGQTYLVGTDRHGNIQRVINSAEAARIAGQRGPVAAPAETVRQPKPEHLEKLRADPNLAPMFDEVYGPGAAQRHLGGVSPAASGQPQQPAAAQPQAPAPAADPYAGLPYTVRKKAREARGAELGKIDEKAVLEADKAIESGRDTARNLTEMMRLNQTAFHGPGAKLRGTVGALTGIGGRQAGADTLLLENKLISGALEQLRATFGGNPTEGERAILVDIQGSVGQPADVRQKIFEDAMHLTRRRILRNQDRVARMRAGTFLLTSPTEEKYDDNTPVPGITIYKSSRQ